MSKKEIKPVWYIVFIESGEQSHELGPFKTYQEAVEDLVKGTAFSLSQNPIYSDFVVVER